MANTCISAKFSYEKAREFVRELYSTDPEKTVKYIFIGNSIPYQNSDSEIPDIDDTVKDEKSVWDLMFAAKKVTGNDVEMILPRYNWESGTIYKQYDDTIDVTELVTHDVANNYAPMFVMNSVGDVYKCLYNSDNSPSLNEPTGDYTSSDGFISTMDAYGNINYIWKYMYNVKSTNKFLSDDYMPVPSLYTQLEYSSSEQNLYDGCIASIVVTNHGSGYINSNTSVIAPYESGTFNLTVADISKANINMFVTGTGIIPSTYITDINSNIITLSLPTSGNGSFGTPIYFNTGVFIEGDGDQVDATAVLDNGSIDRIYVTNIGSGYNFANVSIHGTGTGATARAIISPKFGHGFNPARELMSKDVLITVQYGEVDSTEGGKLSVETEIRQYGLLSNPHLYGEILPSKDADCPAIAVQTLNITLLSGQDFSVGEFVYSGLSPETSTFSGIVHAINQDDNIVRLINTRGIPSIGGVLRGTSFTRIISSVDYQDFQPYSGEILYVKNVLPITRFDGQSEIINLEINF